VTFEVMYSLGAKDLILFFNLLKSLLDIFQLSIEIGARSPLCCFGIFFGGGGGGEAQILILKN
jgi:hypothetical protein